MVKQQKNKSAKPKGKGKMKSKVNSSSNSRALNNLSGMVGAALGNVVAPGMGGLIGGALGRGAHTLLKTITGFGDYKVGSNTVASDTVPKFTSHGRGMRVAHREYIGDITSSSSANTFKLQSFPIQPGIPGVFPWLSGLANLFQVYKFHGLVFEFKTTSSDALNSTNTALGTVIMATQYNSLDAPFLNKIQMENTDFVVSAKPSCSILHPIECNPRENTLEHLYVRSAASNPTGDLRFTDMGIFNIASTGMQGTNVNIGELWASYDVEFLKPIIQTDQSENSGLMDHYRLDGTSISSSKPFGSLPSLQPGSNFGTVVAVNSNIIGTPQYNGDILIVYEYINDGTLAAATLPGFTLGTNMSSRSILTGGSNWQVNTNTALAALTKAMGMTVVSQTTASSITFGASTVLTNPIAGDLWVIAIPTGIT